MRQSKPMGKGIEATLTLTGFHGAVRARVTNGGRVHGLTNHIGQEVLIILLQPPALPPAPRNRGKA